MAIDRGSVGARAKEHREKHGWTVREVGEWSGIDFATVSKIENGDRQPTDEHVTKLAEGLRVPEAWLLGMES